MPAKRRKLPHPCPICKSTNGTVQIVFFSHWRKVQNRISRYDAWNRRPKPKHRGNGSGGSDNGVFRIGHYDSNSYQKIKKENNDPYNFQTEETKKQKLRTSQRKWCSFRSEILNDRKFWGLAASYLGKPKNLPFYDDIRDEVYENGWQMIEQNKKL